MPHLRVAEWINLLTFSGFSALGWMRHSRDRARRNKIAAIGAAGLAITAFASLALPAILPELAASVCRDWVPYLLLLMVYWQAGQFVTRTDSGFEARLEQLDRRMVIPVLEQCAQHPAGGWILGYLEFAYMFCYASMPLGLGTLYVLRAGREADHYWGVVLPATYLSYAMLAVVQTRPPRRIGEKWRVTLPSGKLRALNLWILRHASIHTNTFPSGHVASTTACALVLLRVAPLWVGLLFFAVAVSIALGAVAGRYHYAADVILAALLAAAVFGVETVLDP